MVSCQTDKANDTAEPTVEDSGSDETEVDTGQNETGQEETGQDDSASDSSEDIDEPNTDPDEEGDFSPCLLMMGEAMPLEAATLLEEAAQSLIVVDKSVVWEVAPGADERFITVQVDGWMSNVHLLTSENVTVTLDYMGESAELLAGPEPLEDCPGVVFQHYYGHEWGSLIAHIQGDGAAKLAVYIAD